MNAAQAETVFVEAPARLHFGVLDLRGARGRWFGGLGASAPTAKLLVSVREAEALEVEGEDADRARGFARRVLAYHGLAGGAHVAVLKSLPPHVGLGSGTQLALAVARALEELHGISTDAAELASAVGRADRSAIGTYAFEGGGLIVEGGRRPESQDIAPMLARLPFPPTWRCVVGVPDAARGMSGAAEAAAFDDLPAPAERDVERVAHLALMGLLPAVADADLEMFGEALSAIQAITGRWWEPAQGGVFRPGATEDLVRAMTRWGARGVGQSSWGPAVYGIVEGEIAGRELAGKVRATLGPNGRVYEGPFPAEGARVWRAAAGEGENRSYSNRA